MDASVRTASTPRTTSPAAYAASASRMSARAVGSLRTARVSSSSARSSGLDDHRGSATVAGDGHSLVLALDPVDDVAEVVSDLAQRLNAHDHNCGAPPPTVQATTSNPSDVDDNQPWVACLRHAGVHQAALAQAADIQLNVGPLDPRPAGPGRWLRTS